ncbi:LysR family transcriptional regulator [Pacificoceanicola onchidii]|uniref:LysR family transcriptional regulator n=1 Tax=Pacificoceanicola onchidii TaxID=2562685 RepID=UPI0010A5FD8F|nr:LysR substrate-binding domain-containing protein [Pacificoceanicola onchidii]
MRLEWIDDILAVLDGGSLARAAERRLLTQSAFTRRVRLIEDNVGVTLFDRRRKPVTLMSGIEALEPDFRDLSARLHKLRHQMQTAGEKAARSVAFVCQHALTTTVSPQVVRALSPEGEATVRVRSGNQDECLMHLISKEVEFAIMYALPDDAPLEPGNAFESVDLGADILVPVSTPGIRAKASDPVLPVIGYPSEVFLGQVFAQRVNPQLPTGTAITTIAETALTLAMVQLALTGIGIAWLPQSLVGDHLTQGNLVRLDSILPKQPLIVRMVRLADPRTEHAERVWQHLTQHPLLQTVGD